MALQLSDAVRNARLDAIETAIGVSAILKIRTGAPPANVAAAATGTVFATINLASDWMSAAAAGAKAFSGLPVSDAAADAAGTAGHFEITASNGTTRHMQGTVTATGGGGDMTLDNTSIALGQQVSITGFTLTDGNA